MSTFIGTWGPRLALAGVTLLGGGLGAGLNYSQVDETDPFAHSGAADTDTPSTSGNDPFAKENIRYVPMDEPVDTSLVKTPTPEEVERFKIPDEAKPKLLEDSSYEFNVLGRQVAGPLVEVITSPLSYRGDALGGYWMTYVHRTQEPKDAMYSDSGRLFYSRKNALGRYFRKQLPEEYRNRPLTREDQVKLRRMGAAKRSNANAMMLLPYATRLVTNIVALNAMKDDGTNGLGMAEKSVIFADTAMVSSHISDYALYTMALRQISKGNEARATRTLSMYHRVNILSNALSIAAGGLRLYAEVEREERTGKSNPTSFFFGFMDIAFGGTGMIFSIYLLRHLRNLRRRREEEGKELCAEKANNTLLGIFKFNTIIQDSMRGISALGASAALGMNFSSILQNGLGLSSSMGFAGSGFALGAAYLMTPARYPISRKFMVGASLFIATQTIYDFWPMIMHLLGMA